MNDDIHRLHTRDTSEMRLFFMVTTSLLLAACGGSATTPFPAPANTPEPTQSSTETLAPTAMPAATSTPISPTVPATPGAVVSDEAPGPTQVPISPSLTQLRPQEASPGAEIEIDGSGGHIELRTADGTVTGYIESATSFALFFDGQPVGSVDCFVNTCRGTMTVPANAAPGSHQVSVEGGSSRVLRVVEQQFMLHTTAFADGGEVPTRYSCDGEDISPQLSWSAPPGTKSFALVVDDPDAPGGSWDHWVVFNIPADRLDLAEGQPQVPQLPGGGVHGKNSWGDSEYGGPCPPKGPAHEYRFFLFAVDTGLELSPGASTDEVLDALEGHIVAETMITGTYKR